MKKPSSILTALADELIFLRAQQKALEQRGAAVRAQILSMIDQDVKDQTIPGGPGAQADVRIETRTSRRFDQTLLPNDVRWNPRYARHRTATYVRVVPHAPPPVYARFDMDVIDRYGT
ncbi:MAG: hypothetical protein AAFQ19_05530 [Pseudomonadota bacterium]